MIILQTRAVRLLCVIVVAGSVCMLGRPVAAQTSSFYCRANLAEARVFYLTGIFTASADTRDVISAWTQYLEQKGIHPGQAAGCEKGDPATLQNFIDISKQAITSNPRGPRIVAVDWKFSADMVPASDPGLMYGFCHSATSVANVTYVSSVFGMSLGDAMQHLAVVPFFQFLHAKYGVPEGIEKNQGLKPSSDWCAMVGNISDANRAKEKLAAELASSTRQIVETDWKYQRGTP